MITKRERYLMREAFQAGYSRGHNDTVEGCVNLSCIEEAECFTEWLDCDAADAVTVADVLDKLAQKADRR